MITGSAPTGSSTPPIWAAAERCTRLPICAHEPTSAWLSIMVPASTYAPTLTYIGGMQTTPGATYAPSRMLDPPGTMRTPSASVVGRTGYVSLSKNLRVGCADMSVRTPMRNPTRIPCLTHALTHHVPSRPRSAARISPRVSAARNSANSARSGGPQCSPFWEASASMRSRSDMRGTQRQSQRSQDHAQAGPGLLLHRDEREPESLFQESHQRERGLDGSGVRFDEVDRKSVV